MPVHVEPHNHVMDFADKLSGSYSHRVPAQLTTQEKEVIENIVRRAKDSLGLRHIGTVDVIISPRRGVYVLDVNTHPHFHAHAPFLKSLEAVGSNEEQLIAHLIKLALKR
jgi:D-alanine-D-alanine ligase-like ATP-grasp enzyme